MKSVAFIESLPIENNNALLDFTSEKPSAKGKDILVAVRAVSVNPVDYKIRLNMPPEDNKPKIIGWDASGEVVAIGEEVENFVIGDHVFYAGDLTRPGSNAEFQLVDERIVGNKPKNLTFGEAAALPLTTITAWELLFDHLQLDKQTEQKPIILVTGAAGGVGSILIQLAKELTNATVIATASRESTTAWVKKLGADHVINHKKDLKQQLAEIGIDHITHAAGLNGSNEYFPIFIDLLQPFGKIVIIDDPGEIDIALIKPKSLSFHWEFMFARSMFNAPDMAKQGQLLNKVSALVDKRKIVTTMNESLGIINADNLRKAHALLESGKSQGKIVLEGF